MSLNLVHHSFPPLTYEVDKTKSPVCSSLLAYVHDIGINSNKIIGNKRPVVTLSMLEESVAQDKEYLSCLPASRRGAYPVLYALLKDRFMIPVYGDQMSPCC